MAALDFPSSPTVNQLYVAGNGVTYQWNGTMWLPVGGSSSIYIGDVPPNNPGPGQFWFKSDEARLYIWYNDGDTTQWVPTAPIPGPVAATPPQLLQTKVLRTNAMLQGSTQFMSSGNDMPIVITQGNEYLALPITPLSATSRLVVTVVLYGSFGQPPGLLVTALFQDAITNALASSITRYPTTSGIMPMTIVWDAISGSTTARTFRVRAGGNQAGNFTLNGEGGVRVGGGSLYSSILIQEVLP